MRAQSWQNQQPIRKLVRRQELFRRIDFEIVKKWYDYSEFRTISVFDHVHRPLEMEKLKNFCYGFLFSWGN